VTSDTSNDLDRQRPNRSFGSPRLRCGLLANRCRMKFTYLYRYRLAEIPTMDENRKYALFFAATIRAARKLQALDSEGSTPSPRRDISIWYYRCCCCRPIAEPISWNAGWLALLKGGRR
jgi:hypothetical protein